MGYRNLSHLFGLCLTKMQPPACCIRSCFERPRYHFLPNNLLLSTELRNSAKSLNKKSVPHLSGKYVNINHKRQDNIDLVMLSSVSPHHYPPHSHNSASWVSFLFLSEHICLLSLAFVGSVTLPTLPGLLPHFPPELIRRSPWPHT